MRKVYVVADNIFSPLGKNTRDNMFALKQGRSAILEHHTHTESFYAALFAPEDKTCDTSTTVFENIIISSALDAIQNAGLNLPLDDKKTGFILSTTKGNISLIENLPDEFLPQDRVFLNTSSSVISDALGLISEPLVVSHACISGLLAMITGMRLIQSGLYDHLVVSGGDLITPFIYSGFRSFQAISPRPCT